MPPRRPVTGAWPGAVVPAALAVVIVMAGCGAERFPSAVDLAADPTQQAELARGRAAYLARCSGCHALYAPSLLPPADWPGEVARMAKRAKLDGTQRQDITAYLVAAAR